MLVSKSIFDREFSFSIYYFDKMWRYMSEDQISHASSFHHCLAKLLAIHIIII